MLRYFKLIVNSLAIILTSIAWVYIFVVGIKNIFRYNGFKQELNKLTMQVDNAKIEHQQLQIQIKDMKDPLYWDLLARKQLNYKRNDETVYKFIYKFQNWR
ncbi:hypothetical protein DID77_03820 [Candidatus Marinamargulisbacteria bacterium SCGC AG-439-L15]|nr:hypothetical protein DID77_03820 [Candidatus Marinamargulisbacteria bacterium SCGC AG-439-L15]